MKVEFNDTILMHRYSVTVMDYDDGIIEWDAFSKPFPSNQLWKRVDSLSDLPALMHSKVTKRYPELCEANRSRRNSSME